MQNVMFFVRSLLCARIRLVTCVIEEHTVVSACDDIISGNEKHQSKCEKSLEVTVVSACYSFVSENEKHLSECKKFLEVTVANACYNIVSYPKVNF